MGKSVVFGVSFCFVSGGVTCLCDGTLLIVFLLSRTESCAAQCRRENKLPLIVAFINARGYTR